jgi:nucleoside-diphosphate-sugar epimerase
VTRRQVLVTGGSGFIAGYCILRLLADGHHVRATLRSLNGKGGARAALEQAGLVGGDRLHFVAADLLEDAGWRAAMDGITHVLHVASPVRPGPVPDPDALITAAREGTLRVLRAARASGIERVVLTSAFHAVSWGLPRQAMPFTEADWTRVDGPGVDAYGRSKTLAERAAWEFNASQSGGPELTTMLPVAVMGPIFGGAASGANGIVQRMLSGAMPALPDLYIPIVDVRDVADAHVLAMTSTRAAGERFLLSNGAPLSLAEIAAVLRQELGRVARQVPVRRMPDWLIRAGALFSPEMRAIVHDLGYAKQTSNAKARRLLGWTPRAAEDAIVAAARSMVR